MIRTLTAAAALVAATAVPAGAEIHTVSRVCVSAAEYLAASEATTRRQVERVWRQGGTVDPHYQLLTPDGEYVDSPSTISVNYRQCARPHRRRGVTVYYEKRPRGWMVLAKLYPGRLP